MFRSLLVLSLFVACVYSEIVYNKKDRFKMIDRNTLCESDRFIYNRTVDGQTYQANITAAVRLELAYRFNQSGHFVIWEPDFSITFDNFILRNLTPVVADYNIIIFSTFNVEFIEDPKQFKTVGQNKAKIIDQMSKINKFKGVAEKYDDLIDLATKKMKKGIELVGMLVDFNEGRLIEKVLPKSDWSTMYNDMRPNMYYGADGVKEYKFIHTAIEQKATDFYYEHQMIKVKGFTVEHRPDIDWIPFENGVIKFTIDFPRIMDKYDRLYDSEHERPCFRGENMAPFFGQQKNKQQS